MSGRERELEGEIALVTGGSSGIGKEIVHSLLKQGAKVVVMGTNRERGIEVTNRFQEEIEGSFCTFYKVDVSQREEVKEACLAISQEWEDISILINNAGIARDDLLIRMREEDWDRVLAVNLKSLYNTTQSVMQPMIRKKKGVIVNISSVVGLRGNAGQTNYCASKAGIIGFTKALAREVAIKGIRVNCVAPGFIKTEMTEKLIEQQATKYREQIPMRRFGNCQDVAALVTFLVGNDSQYITGQVFPVDGGLSA